MQEKQNKTKAFTLIELLVVVSIIAALMTIMATGLNKVKQRVTNLKQKGEFHGMEISIELFYNEFGYYPDSSRVDVGGTYTCGAQHLAEAMEGRDKQGFHPKSRWHPDLEPTPPDDLYTDTTLKQRKPVYFELKHTGMYTLDQLWGAGNTGNLHGGGVPGSAGWPGPAVLTDVFLSNAVTGADETAGSPVLYFKADSTKRFRTSNANPPVVVTNPTSAQYQSWIYNFDDNIDILNLALLGDSGDTDDALPPHYQERKDYPGVTDAELFYQILTHREDSTTGFYKPYNADTYILISAGWDGIYGTKDDITNFNY